VLVYFGSIRILYYNSEEVDYLGVDFLMFCPCLLKPSGIIVVTSVCLFNPELEMLVPFSLCVVSVTNNRSKKGSL